MPDRVPSDHPAVETRRVPVVRHGGPSGRAVGLDGGTGPSPGDRVVLDGTERFAAVVDGRLVGLYDTPSAARERTGTDRLSAWLDAARRGPGASVLLDVVDTGYRYGLREPGTRAVYDAGRPDESLSGIAERLGG
jgi:hypothetical protein